MTSQLALKTRDPKAAMSEDTTFARFIEAFRNHPAGVAVVTADAGGGPVALTATSVCSVNATPTLLAFSVSGKSSSSPTIRQAESVVVHLLSTEQKALAQLCSTSGVDRFADRSMWTRLETGEPYFPEVAAWIRGKVVGQLEASGSALILVEATHVGGKNTDPNSEPGQPLVYHRRTWHGLGEFSTLA